VFELPALHTRDGLVGHTGMNRQINLAKSAAHPQRPEGRADALIVHRPRSSRKALRGCLSEAA